MKSYYKVSLVYLLLGVVWITTSDQVVSFISPNMEVVTSLQTIKGWLYVAISTLLIFFLMRAEYVRLEREQLEKKNVFKKTIEGSLHILLNYFNEMQLIRLEAEMCPDFDKSLIEQSVIFTDQAADELKRLSELDIVDSNNIDLFLYRKLRTEHENIPSSNQKQMHQKFPDRS